MKPHALRGILLIGATASAQSAAPAFELADAHLSPRRIHESPLYLHANRLELHGITMLN